MLDKQAHGIIPFCHSRAPTDYSSQFPRQALWSCTGEQLFKVSMLLLSKCPSQLPADHQSSVKAEHTGIAAFVVSGRKDWITVTQTESPLSLPIKVSASMELKSTTQETAHIALCYACVSKFCYATSHRNQLDIHHSKDHRPEENAVGMGRTFSLAPPAFRVTLRLEENPPSQLWMLCHCRQTP